MFGFVLRRILLAVPTLLLVALAVFLLVRLIPGDPALLMLGDQADATSVATLRRSLGLDRALPLQFVYWLGHVLSGDLGRSIAQGVPVAPLIVERFQVSATTVAVLRIGIVIGYVRPELKFPPIAFGFLATNLLFTCVAEEAFFRGLTRPE